MTCLICENQFSRAFFPIHNQLCVKMCNGRTVFRPETLPFNKEFLVNSPFIRCSIYVTKKAENELFFTLIHTLPPHLERIYKQLSFTLNFCNVTYQCLGQPSISGDVQFTFRTKNFPISIKYFIPFKCSSVQMWCELNL